MIEIVNQNKLDTLLFIANDTPPSKLIGINLGLMKKGYTCTGMDSITKSSYLSGQQYYDGIKVRYTKTRESRRNFHFNLKNVTEDSETISTVITELFGRGIDVSLEITPSIRFVNCEIIRRFSQHLILNDSFRTLPRLRIAERVNILPQNLQPIDKSDSDEHLIDQLIYKLKIFEENYHNIYPLLILQNFASTEYVQRISLTNCEKIIQFSNMLSKLSIPPFETRKKFIDICQIFKDNKVINRIKVNNLEFVKDDSCLNVSLFSIKLVQEVELKRFLFFDHPGINLLTDYINKYNLFDNIEAKMAKEIFIRI